MVFHIHMLLVSDEYKISFIEIASLIQYSNYGEKNFDL